MSCRTALSNPSFRLALSNISLSYEFRVISRYTFTALLWPIRWHRAWACGIQSMFITIWYLCFLERFFYITDGNRWSRESVTLYKRCSAFTCKSFCGFQSESNMIQVSAAVRLMPRPPARVQRRNTKRSESTLLKRSMAACLRFPRTLPSIRSYVYLHAAYKFQIRNIVFASNPHKTYWPICFDQWISQF